MRSNLFIALCLCAGCEPILVPSLDADVLSDGGSMDSSRNTMDSADSTAAFDAHTDVDVDDAGSTSPDAHVSPTDASSTDAPARATLGAIIDFEGASVDAEWNIVEDDATYRLNRVAVNGAATPRLDWGRGRTEDTHYLRSRLEPYVGSTQRVEHYIAEAVRLDDGMRYYEWDLAIPFGPLPTGWTVLHQLRQDGDSGSPIVALEVIPNPDALVVALLVRNTTHHFVAGMTGSLGNAEELGRVTLSRGAWHHIVLGVDTNQSDATRSGRVSLVIDDVTVVDWTGDVGFPAGFLGQRIFATFTTHIGLYRAAQPNAFETWIDNYRQSR